MHSQPHIDRDKRVSFYTFILTKIRETRSGIDAAFMHGGLRGAKREYPTGITMEDVLKDLEFGQLTNAYLPGSVIIDLVKESHGRGTVCLIAFA